MTAIFYEADEDEDMMATDQVVCLRETEKALLVLLTNDKEVWVPKSCLGDDSEVHGEDDAGTLVVKRWWLDKQPWA